MKNRHLSAALAAAIIGAKKASQEGWSLVARFGVFFILVITYGNIFKGLPPLEIAAYGLDSQKMTWYFALTEIFLFCGVIYAKDFQYDIQEDLITSELVRPTSLWMMRVADWIGQHAMRFVLLIVPAGLLTGLMAHDFSLLPRFLLGAVLFFPGAMLIYLTCHFIVGAGCLWVKQADPLYWVFQKLLFIGGGLLWPLFLYPEPVRFFLGFTPFPSILFSSGLLILGRPVWEIAAAFAAQIFWAAVLLKTASHLNEAMLRRLQRQEG